MVVSGCRVFQCVRLGFTDGPYSGLGLLVRGLLHLSSGVVILVVDCDEAYDWVSFIDNEG